MALTPEQWQEYHDSYTTLTLPTNVQVSLTKQSQPEYWHQVAKRAIHFWQGSQNDTLYALTQAPEGFDLQAFPLKFSEFRYAKKHAPTDSDLDEQIKPILKRIQILCVASSLEINHHYLTGIKAQGVMQDHRELVPQGLVDESYTLEQTIAKELQEETSLDPQIHLQSATPTHLHYSSKFGECTLVYALKATSKAANAFVCSSEHEELELLSPQEMSQIPKYQWNHASYRIAKYHQLITLG